MARLASGATLVLASTNAGKLRELEAMLAPRGIRIVAGAGLPEVAETGASFAENAALKARSAAAATNLPALADDSGLAIEALEGRPGVRSARFAEEAGGYPQAFARLREALDGRDPAARFVCALALAWPDGHLEAMEGECRGRLVFPPRGAGGFGYDPIFEPLGHARTFGEMTGAEKQALSHRGKALAALSERCLD